MKATLKVERTCASTELKAVLLSTRLFFTPRREATAPIDRGMSGQWSSVARFVADRPTALSRQDQNFVSRSRTRSMTSGSKRRDVGIWSPPPSLSPPPASLLAVEFCGCEPPGRAAPDAWSVFALTDSFFCFLRLLFGPQPLLTPRPHRHPRHRQMSDLRSQRTTIRLH